MIYNILAAAVDVQEVAAKVHAQPRAFVSIFGIVTLLIYVGLLVLIITGLIRLVRFLGSARKEQKLIRMELGKLADEVHLIRQKLEGGKEQDSSAESG